MPNHLTLLFTSDFYSLPTHLQKEVYHDFYKLVYPLVYFIVKDHQAAEDIIQESFLRAIHKSLQLQDLDKLEVWLKALARSVTLNYLRKFKRARNELDGEDVLFSENSAAGYATPIENEVEAKMMREAICRYVSVLKPEYRQLIAMRWNEQLTYKEMAAAMNTSEGVVRQKLFRAREAVKIKLEEEWGIR